MFVHNPFFYDLRDKLSDKVEIYTFNEFYATNVFKKIKEQTSIDKNNRVASIGLHPSIAAYNGLYTIDGYSSNYELAYKHKFRKLIIEELNKNPSNKEYFDNWGSRCYVFDDELGRNFDVLKTSNNIPKVISLDLNMEQAKSMNLKYIISTVPIKENDDYLLIHTLEDKLRNYFIYGIK